MRKILIVALAGIAVAGCDKRPGLAEQIVRNELKSPQSAEFRHVRMKGKEPIVCGEVLASDQPAGGWRHFVAYTEIGRAAVAPTSDTITAEAEMDNPLLKGAAEQFLHACD